MNTGKKHASKGKRRVALLLVAAMLFASAWTPQAFLGAEKAEAASSSVQHYFYDQLDREAKLFYDAMYEMYRQGILETGNGSYDLVAAGAVTQRQLEDYANGDSSLLNTLGAARDAFYADYPEIFYVDFSYLSIRVTQDREGYHAYLGTGRSDSYRVKGFDSEREVQDAIRAVDAKVDEIASAARSLKIEPGEDRVEQQIKYVHNAIIQHTSYRLENACKPGNEAHIRTVYGPLLQHESVCEGYARAFKMVLDRLEIPCVLVHGVYRSGAEDMELHMWNEVQLNGKWYAVDATFDDPIMPNSNPSQPGLDGGEKTQYLLVGEDIIGRNHVPCGIMSPANFEFTYPSLELGTEKYETVADNNGLVVELDDEVYDRVEGGDDNTTAVFRVSYNHMGYTKAAAQGKYILVRFYQYYPGNDTWKYNDWIYADPKPYAITETDEYVLFPCSHCRYIEFAVTDVAPRGPLYGPDFSEEDWDNVYFHGDPSLFLAESSKIYNPKGTYVAPPYPQQVTPRTTGRIFIGNTYPVKIVYDDKLLPVEGQTVGYSLSTPKNPSAKANCKIENFHFDGDRTITFDFTPSKMFADDCALYEFSFTGLMGDRSHKTPQPVSYVASYPCAVCAYVSQGYDWNVFGQPSLLEDSDLSMNGWKTKDGEPIDEALKHRLVLVASRPTPGQTEEMNDLVSEEFPEENVLTSETYNINLSICKAQVIQTGQGVRVSVGFPEGYGPDDAGVTFKAYHFQKNDAGEVIGVEEIDCVVTPYGLIITCDSFSPFMIAAVEKTAEDETHGEKTVILSNSEGGEILAGDSIFKLHRGEVRHVTVRADDGYVLESLNVGEERQHITDDRTMELTLDYDALKADETIVDARFVSEAVQAKETARGETAVTPVLNGATMDLDDNGYDDYDDADDRYGDAEVTLPARETVAEGARFVLEPWIDNLGRERSYQWYKDGSRLYGETGPILVFEEVRAEDAGRYKLEVVARDNDGILRTVSSNTCRLTVEKNGNSSGQNQEVLDIPTSYSAGVLTLRPELSLNSGGEARLSLNRATVSHVLQQAPQDSAVTRVAVAPLLRSGAAKFTLSMDRDTVAHLAAIGGAALTLDMDFADLTLSAAELDRLASRGGNTITFTAAKTPTGQITAEVAVNGQPVSVLTDAMQVEIPAGSTRPSMVLAQVQPGGGETILKKSALHGSTLAVQQKSGATLRVKENAKTFQDVTSSYWASEAIQFVTAREIFGGVSATEFAPDTAMTRGMIATVLWRMEGEQAAGSSPAYTDVPADYWCSGAVNWASARNIVSGYGDQRFGVEDPITREQLASMLERYAASIGVSLTADGDLGAFPDGGAVSEWARGPMRWAVGNGLLGTRNGNLDPASYATRAEVAVALQALIQKMA